MEKEKNQSKERVCAGSHRMEHTKGYERTKAYPEPKNSDPDLNQTWLPSPSPRDPGRDTKNQIGEQSQQPTQAKSVSKHEWLQSPSPQDSKIAEERWGAVNKLNSHTVRQRCIQYSMCQYMRIERAAEGKHFQEIRMDPGEQVSPVLHDAPRRLQSVMVPDIVMKGVELNDWMETDQRKIQEHRSMWEKQRENAELREASWCLDNANEEESAEDIEEEDRDDTAQDPGDAQKIAKGRESTIGSDQGHRVEREVEGHLQETQRKTGKLQIGWIVKSKAVE
ncbi:hypothetical protein GGX14DRAFT_406208 [Mycena pura]|uniref:Uncharacterized protein n=1 Tax=Mycena pura TaxID=153505 RepID=A0AAD6UQR5_9AGAR|nr:hypothetical protein GGX14DRAFT_406208 [Mycena pura]